MPFRVTARTILQLGGELISSDGIAFYELIKNAFDAQSRKVFVDVVVRLPVHAVNDAMQQLDRITEADKGGDLESHVGELKSKLIAATINSPLAEEWSDTLEEAGTVEELRRVIDRANFIKFRDLGDGMSLQELDDVYLTVGTPKRLLEREAARAKGKKSVILGEKGIGRLSAMRLGSRLHVKTSTLKDNYWNLLEIDWRSFGENRAQLVEEIDVEPTRGSKKKKSSKGTTITISRLSSSWSVEKLRQVANADLSRLTDPFADSPIFPIHLKFNGAAVSIPRMSDILREHAHAVVEAWLEFEENEDGEWDSLLSGEVRYLISGTTGGPLTGRNYKFKCSDPEIASLVKKNDPDLDLDAVVSLGPVSMQCYWFNRRLLKSIQVNDEKLDLKRLVRQWSGGLMVYRDGFRVPPYGSADDDWLDLDRKALASQGYKVNRAQLVGKVDISAEDNPALIDQTNREGLCDCAEKQALIAILKYALESEFREYIVEVDKELREKERISFDALSEQLADVEDRINVSLDRLDIVTREHPDLGIDKVEHKLRSAFKIVVDVVNTTQEAVESAEDEKGRLLHLAALGLSIEKLAHELNRAARHALLALKNIGSGAASKTQTRTATLQLTSLQKRLQNLDPLLTPTRQRKTEFDLCAEVNAIIAGYEAQFERHRIRCRVVETEDGPTMVKLVRAMVIQVLENLIDNSVYWLTLRTRRKGSLSTKRQIKIVIDGTRSCLEVSDTGPGIALENRERVFRPFFTLKPAGRGKGLGLYIAREIAEYHGGTLTLSEKGLRKTGRLNTFVLDFKAGRV